MRTSVKIIVVGTAAVLGLVPVVAVAAPPGPGPRPGPGPSDVRVSRGDPFAGCTVGGSPGSVNYPGAEVEPSVTVDPRSPRRVVGAWQQDRWSDGGSRGLVAGYSSDGGRTFAQVAWPVTRCAGGLDYERASDPWVSTGPDGTTYGSALSFDQNTPRTAVVATTSSDGGRTWRNTTPLIADTSLQFFNDKNSVTADPKRPGVAYQVWDRLESSPDASLFVTGPSLMSVTRDFGRTWSKPQVIVNTAPFQQTIGNVIVADPRTGTLYNFYDSIQYTDATAAALAFIRFEVVRSTDAGRTWSAPSVIADDTSVADVDPRTGEALRTGTDLPSPAVDPRTGELYMAYAGSDFTDGAYNQIQLVHSKDGGRTWGAPVRVNGDPASTAFTPSIAVNSEGDVGVTYYDLRTLTSTTPVSSGLPTSTWLTVSPRGGTQFGAERQIHPVFDLLLAPNARGYFLGDYQALAAYGETFRPFFVATNAASPKNPTDVFTSQWEIGDDERASSQKLPAATSPKAAGVNRSAAVARAPKFPLRSRH